MKREGSSFWDGGEYPTAYMEVHSSCLSQETRTREGWCCNEERLLLLQSTWFGPQHLTGQLTTLTPVLKHLLPSARLCSHVDSHDTSIDKHTHVYT